MDFKAAVVNGSGPKDANGTEEHHDNFTTSIPEVPVTVQRRPFKQPDADVRLHHTGTARANLASTEERPEGTTEQTGQRSTKSKLYVHRLGITVATSDICFLQVLQQHCEFFDQDRDGVIWPLDTYRGFHALGFNIPLSLLAVFIIHANFSYPTISGWIPDPFFRVYTNNIHKDKHGSDSGTYDTEGRFLPQKFEDMFSKYAEGREYMTLWDLVKLTKGQRLIADPIGWGGALFEWLATYIMLWPEDGKMKKEDIRRIYDGSLFYVVAAKRAQK